MADKFVTGKISLVEHITQEVLDSLPAPGRVMAPFRWFGGKGHFAPWLLRHLPPRERVVTYVEPFAGAASLLWHLPEPYPVEVLNDLDERIVNLFRVLQDREKFEELARRLVWTPYSRAEFGRAFAVLEEWDAHDEVTRAWAFFTAQNQGFGGRAGGEGNWGRTIETQVRGTAQTANSWRVRLKLLPWWHDRLTRVQIDRVDAIQAIQYWDTPNTFFYIDPPYVHSTRKSGKYRYEMSDEEHEHLVSVLLGIQGMAMLSGYPNPIYARLEEAGWRRYDKATACHAAGRTRGSGLQGEGAVKAKVPRTESIWLNYEPAPLSGKPEQKRVRERLANIPPLFDFDGHAD